MKAVKLITACFLAAVVSVSAIISDITVDADGNIPSASSPALHSYEIDAEEKGFRSTDTVNTAKKLSIVKYEQVDPVAAALKQTMKPGQIASSVLGAAAGPDAPLSMAEYIEPGQFAFTTYGFGHGVGLSQNGANAYATYGGYNYQQILFHYYPGTSLVQTTIPEYVTAGGKTGSVVDIVSMIVYNEMSNTMHMEAMKAQAVAVYTYIMNSESDNSSLICKANPPENVVEAVKSVLGQALFYNGSYALTVYSASSGGYTASSYDVFRTNYPYLISVSCPYDAMYDPHYGTVTYLSAETVKQKLQAAYGVTLSGSPNTWIVLNVGGGGYINSAVIGGTKTVTGESLRSVLGLKSGRYTFVTG